MMHAGESPPVAILLYHSVSATPGHHVAPFSVAPDDFEAHLDAVVEAGCRSLTLSELVEERSRGVVDAQPTVVITFDDGYADFATAALPALASRGLRSTLYLTTGWLAGRGPTEPGPDDRMLDWSQVRELAEAGVELGAHSHRHPHMDTLRRSALTEELAIPKRLLEDELGAPVPSFAYPHGYNGPAVRRALSAHGYSSGAAVREALSPPGDSPDALARLMVRRETTPEVIARWVRGRDAPVAVAREQLATRGWRGYRRTRSVLSRRPGSVYR